MNYYSEREKNAQGKIGSLVTVLWNDEWLFPFARCIHISLTPIYRVFIRISA